MTIIVHGATGAQGSPIRNALMKAGWDVRALSRTGSPADPAVVGVDLADPVALTAAYDGAEGVFYHLPMGGTPEQETRWNDSVATAAITQGVRHVVVSSSGRPLGTPPAQGLDRLIARLRDANIKVTALATHFYLENLLLPPVLAAVRAESVLRYPISDTIAISWTNHLDVADAATAVFRRRSAAPDLVELGHLPPLTGADLAHGLSVHADRDVTFAPMAPAVFGAAIAALVGAQAAAAVADLYASIAEVAHISIHESVSAQTLLGLTPRSVGRWLGDLGADLSAPHRASAVADTR